MGGDFGILGFEDPLEYEALGLLYITYLDPYDLGAL